MESRLFETAFGQVRVWGAFATFSPDRSLLFVSRGAFMPEEQLLGITEAFPEVDVAYVHPPGLHSPFFENDRVEDFAAAFDEVLTALGHRRITVLGQSLGGLIALAMRQPNIRAMLLVDPPLATAPVWILPSLFRPRAKEDPRLARWIFDLFGISGTEVVNRDYRSLLDGLSCTALVLVGQEPLGEPRPVEKAPSAVSEEDRARFAAHPRVQMEVAPGAGHNIPLDATPYFVRALRRTLAACG